MNLNKKYNFP